MLVQPIQKASQPAHVVVLASEKGGSGKSTVALHIAVALLKAGQRVATVDLDSRQKTFTHYIENRRAWAERTRIQLELPTHYCIERAETSSMETNETTEVANFSSAVSAINDSFLDFDVLATLDPINFAVTGESHYAKMVHEARHQRRLFDGRLTDWIVVRNRLSELGSRNKRLVGEGLTELAKRMGFRWLEGFAERLVYREFFPRGLTALDDLDTVTLDMRPNKSHITAREEVIALLNALHLPLSKNGKRHAAALAQWYSVREEPLQLHEVVA
jgi:chromosome partitioning protein